MAEPRRRIWRVVRALPARGQIGIFNRSYYEEVVADRVHPEKLDKWTLPDEAKGKDIWTRMYREINNFEEYLTGNGIHILKFFLNMSKEKQRQRLLERAMDDSAVFMKIAAEELPEARESPLHLFLKPSMATGSLK